MHDKPAPAVPITPHRPDATPGCPGRRQAIVAGACLCLGLDPLGLAQAASAEPADQRPTKGDRLVAATAEGSSVPLAPADVKLGAKPVPAFPFDPQTKTVRDGSRLNKVLLVRLAPEALDADTRARAADGVVAFSGVCTHEGCDVTEWSDSDKTLLCFCHFSKFDPAQAGEVKAGPAPRNLPFLPIALDGGAFTVTGPFSASPGAKKAA